MKKKRKLSNKKLLARLKKITIICIIILLIEFLYIGYHVIFHRTKSLYFDGINAVVNNDSYYVTVGSNNNNNFHYEKAKISKYNLKKEKTFEKLYNVGYNSAFFGVALDENNIVAVGSYESSFKAHRDSIRKALIVKYDEDGEIIFSKDFRVLDNSKFTSIMVVDDGYLVTGQSVYKSTKIGDYDGGAILLKYNKDGDLLWTRTYGNNKSAVFNDLIVVDSFIYTVGADKDNLGIICKYDNAGNFIISSEYESSDEIGFSGIVSLNGYLYVSGANYVTSNDTDALIIQYDFDCVFQNQIIYDSGGAARFNKLIVDDYDNLIAIGIVTQDKGNRHKTYSINHDGIIGKYNSSLEKVSVITYGDENDDNFTGIRLIDGNYLVVGYSAYGDGSYLSKFISFSDALKVLGVD